MPLILAGTKGYDATAACPLFRTLSCTYELNSRIHTVVENSDYNDARFLTGSVKDDMTAQAELFVPWLYVIRTNGVIPTGAGLDITCLLLAS